MNDGFLRTASLNILEVSSSKSLFASWKDIVRQSYNEKDSKRFLTADCFSYDPQNFVYFRSRAISSFEKYGCNGNADAFPWEELKKSCDTFIGKGFYIEHNESDPSLAVGIVLDSVAYPEEQYIECLCCVSKNDFPDISSQIEGHGIKSVSMSCIAGEAECSVCNNTATNEYELCKHMRRWADLEHNVMNPYFCKGSLGIDGKAIHELNRNLMFTGLSGVKVPADGDAHIFEIFASKIKKTAAMHFQEYLLAKQAGSQTDMNNLPDHISFKDLYEMELKLEGDENKALENAINLITGGMFDSVEQSEKQKYIDVAKQKLNETKNEMASDSSEVENNKTEKIMADKKEKSKEEKAKSEMDTETKETKPEGEDTSEKEVKPEGKKDLMGEVKKFLEDLKKDEEFESKEIEGIISKIEGKPEGEIDLELGSEEITPEGKPELGEESDLGLEIEDKPASEDKSLMMKYFPGEGRTASEALSKSYFKVSQNGESHIIAAKNILPPNAQKLILAGRQSEVIEPENAIVGLMKEVGSSLKNMIKFASKQKLINRKAFVADPKFAESWSMNAKEIPSAKPEVVCSVDEKEASRGMEDKPRAAKSDVKSYYGRLPSKSETGAEPTVALDKKSSVANAHVKQMREVLAKLRDQEQAIKEKDAKIAAHEETIRQAAKQKEVSEKATKIAKILASINMKDESEKREMRTKLAAMSNETLDATISVLPYATKTGTEVVASMNDSELDGDVPYVSGGNDETPIDDLEMLTRAMAEETLYNAQNNNNIFKA